MPKDQIAGTQQDVTIGNSEAPAKSVVQPIRIVEDKPSIEIELSEDTRKATESQFGQATEYAFNKQWQKAETLYLELIEDFPLMVEPYINLAAVYSQTNRMDEARLVLLQGVKANQNYALLFDNLQSIHGELAAQAYRAALATDGQTEFAGQSRSEKLNVPRISSIDLSPIDLTRQRELAKQLSALQSEQLTLDSSQSRISELEKELTLATNQAVEFDENSSSKVSELEAQLSELKTQLYSQTQALALAEQELVDLRSTSSIDVVAMQTELPKITQPQQAEQTPIEVAKAEQTPIEIAKVDTSQVVKSSNNVESTVTIDDNQKINLASSLVKKWADSWSKQDVAGYISHYMSDYSPPRAEMTHQEWMEQREVRLTNKRFIQVDVSDFDFEDGGEDRFSVTFTQRYRSNTIDDTIRKQLVFAKNDGSLSTDSLMDAKIVDEIIVSN